MVDLKKEEIFDDLENKLIRQGFIIEKQDRTRPWGGFFVINEKQAQLFCDIFFEGIDIQEIKISGKLSPKILIVEPEKRLSWQYHFRRSEIWQVLQGNVGVITSDTDEEGVVKVLEPGNRIELGQGVRHRLVGLKDWGIIAEIWRHTDSEISSDEEDIVRVQDDYGRGYYCK